MRMRAVRSLVVACISVVGCLVIISTLTNTTPATPAALHTFVTHTHNHLNHLQNNIKEEFESFVTAPDPELLLKLGFVENPILYPHTNWTNITTPVIATAVSGSQVEEVPAVVAVAGQVCAGATLLVYTLDLSQRQLEQVEAACNDTCSVVQFDYSQYPSHVKNWRLHAYRPIIIQELLVRAGAVLWLDPSIRLVNPLNASGDTPTDDGMALDPHYVGDAKDDHQYRVDMTSGDGEAKVATLSLQAHTANSVLDGVNSSAMRAMYQDSLVSRYDKQEQDRFEELNVQYNAGIKENIIQNMDRFKRAPPKELHKVNEVKQKLNKRNKRNFDNMHDDDSTYVEGYSYSQNDDKPKQAEPTHPNSTSTITNDLPLALKSAASSDAKVAVSSDKDAATLTEKSAPLTKANAGNNVHTTVSDSKDKTQSSDHSEEDIPFCGSLGEVEYATRSDGSSFELDSSSLLCTWGRLAWQQRGVVAWQLIDPLKGHLPTAALTHPGMFSAMHTPKQLYDFHQMSDAGAVLLYNTDAVHQLLMKPWLSCSLTQHCVQPIGAQDTGCRYDKRPLFRYSGCHLYDTSAFNVALGLMFGPHNHPYQPATPPIFTRAPLTAVTQQLLLHSRYLDGRPAYHADQGRRSQKPARASLVHRSSPADVPSVPRSFQARYSYTNGSRALKPTSLSASKPLAKYAHRLNTPLVSTKTDEDS